MNFLHRGRTVLESDLVCSSHLSGSSIAHIVEELVKHIDLFLTQRILKGDTELASLVRELSVVYLALSIYIASIICIRPFGFIV